jgi:LPS O-antigen subunit length determinant protein (WzzB/FepE family)
MKKILSLSLLLLSIILLSACGKSDEALNQISEEDVQKIYDGEMNGFFVATQNADESYFETLEEVLQENNTSAYFYHTYQPEGKDSELVDKQKFDLANRFDRNKLYYVKDGEVFDPIRLKSLTGLELAEQIQGYIDTHK